MNKENCNTCKWFEDRTNFCRKSPPTPMLITNTNNGYDRQKVAAMFPTVAFPHLDYCGGYTQGVFSTENKDKPDEKLILG